jgi:hypothetical protein
LCCAVVEAYSFEEGGALGFRDVDRLVAEDGDSVFGLGFGVDIFQVPSLKELLFSVDCDDRSQHAHRVGDNAVLRSHDLGETRVDCNGL